MTETTRDNPFAQPRGGFTGQIVDRVPVTPSDTETLIAQHQFIGVGIQATGAGTITWKTWNDTTVSWTFADKELVVCSVKQVMDTGTSATGIIVLKGL